MITYNLVTVIISMDIEHGNQVSSVNLECQNIFRLYDFTWTVSVVRP